MNPPRTRTAGPFLDRATLVVAAADLADRDGWSNLTLSRVAADVDRHISSLYSHVDGLDELRREISLLAVDDLADVVHAAADGRSGAGALESIARAQRDFGRAHPGRLAAVRDRIGVDDPEFRRRALRLAQPVRVVLASFGLDDERVARAHVVFSATVRGLVAPGTAPGTTDDDEVLHTAVGLFVTAIGTGEWPAAR